VRRGAWGACSSKGGCVCRKRYRCVWCVCNRVGMCGGAGMQRVVCSGVRVRSAARALVVWWKRANPSTCPCSSHAREGPVHD